jgi:hypothetical protein
VLSVVVAGLALYCADIVARLCQAQNLTAATLVGTASGRKLNQGEAVVAVDIPVAEVGAVGYKHVAVRFESFCTHMQTWVCWS